MLRKSLLSLAVCCALSINTLVVFGGESRITYNEKGERVWEYYNLPEVKYDENGYRINELPDYEFPEDKVFSDYTTVQYAPWWKLYSFSTPERILAGVPAGDNGQCTYSVAYSPSNPKMILMSTDCNGVYKSTDGGDTWRMSNTGLATYGTSCVKFDPDNENIAYLITSAITEYNPKAHDIERATKPAVGVWKSEDGGESWRQVTPDGQVINVRKYYEKHAINFSDKKSDGTRDVYACALNGLFVSSDEGETWKNILNTEVHNVEISGNKIFATTYQKGLLMSEDNGNTWNEIIFDPDNKDETIDIRKSRTDPNFLLLLTRNQVYYTKDCGKTWGKGAHISSIVEIADGAFFQAVEFGAPDENGHSRTYFTVGPTNFTFKYSTDYGMTINNIKGFDKAEILKLPNLADWLPESFDVHPTNPLEAIAHSYKTINGGETLFHSSAGYSGMRLFCMWINPNDNNDYCCGYIDVGYYRTYDFGRDDDLYPPMLYTVNPDTGVRLTFDENGNKIPIGNASCYQVNVDPRDRNRVFFIMGQSTYTLQESNDGGLNFHPVKNYVGTEVLEFHKENNNIIYTTNFTSYDNGKTWEPNKLPIYAVSNANNDIVFGFDKHYIYRSEDKGKTYKIFNSKDLASYAIQKIYADLTIPDRLYATTYQSGLLIIDSKNVTLKTEEHGFVRPYNGAGTLSILSFAQDPNNPEHVLAGPADTLTSSIGAGLYESFDRGESWKVVPDTPGAVDIWFIKFHPNLPLAFCGTSSGTLVYEFDKLYDRSKSYFSDSKTSYACDMIEYLAKKKIIEGYNDGTFKPQSNISRAEFIQILTKSLDIESDNSYSAFSDVSDDFWAAKSINSAYEAGIILGGDDGRFYPENNISMQEAAVILNRALIYKNVRCEISQEELSMYENTPVWGRYAVASLYKNKVFADNDVFKYMPEEKLKREDMAVALYRLLKLI